MKVTVNKVKEFFYVNFYKPSGQHAHMPISEKDYKWLLDWGVKTEKDL